MRRLVAVLAFGGLMVFQGLGTNVASAADGDGDQVDDEIDVCPAVADPFQGDADGDGVGDLCEDATGVSSFDGTPESELIFGTEEADTLSGAGGDDAIYGLGGDDTLDGGDGRDFLSGGAGADTLTGGPGCDVFAFDPSGDNDVITDFDVEIDRMTFPTPVTDAPAPTPTFGGEENLVVTFVAESEETGTLEFEGLPAGIEISLLSGPCLTPHVLPEEEVIPPDEEEPLVCTPLFPGEDIGQLFGIEIPLDGVQIDGTMDDETLTGTDCSDAIVGDTHIEFFGGDFEDEPLCSEGVCGDDVINGLGGNDLLIGDKTVIENGETGGNDNIDGGDGDDAIIGDAAFIGGCECGGVGDGTHAIDIPGAYGGDDRIFGGDGDDVIFGDAAEVIAGYAFGGDDLIGGGNGDDLLIGDAFTILDGAQAGSDSLDGGDGDDEMYGDAYLGIDEFSFAGEDSLTGGAGDDLLFGDAPFTDGAAASDNFWYDASTDFGDDVIADLGAREVTDNIVFVSNGSGLADLASLDARSTVADDSPDDLLATVYTDDTKVTKVGSILIVGAGGIGIASWADLDAMWPVDIIVIP